MRHTSPSTTEYRSSKISCNSGNDGFLFDAIKMGLYAEHINRARLFSSRTSDSHVHLTYLETTADSNFEQVLSKI